MESNHGNQDASTAHVCDECGHQVTTTWQDHMFVYGAGEAAAELAVRLPVRRCDHCDFDYLDEEGERLKHEVVCRHLGVLTPQEIRGIRERLGLSRSALAKLTGIGEASLGRWESGIKIQTPGYDRYLRLLSRPGIAPLLRRLDDAPSATQPGHTKFRELKVSQAHIKRQASFSLRHPARSLDLAA